MNEGKTRYILSKKAPELAGLKILFGIHVFLLVSAIVMPQYFGIHIGWDITCTRFADMLLIVYVFFNKNVFLKFSETVVKSVVFIPLALYIVVAGYTMVFRVDINAFMQPFLEILTFYMMMFGIRYVIGCRRAIQIIIKCSYFLGIYGLVEFAAGRSLMLMFLKTLPTAVSVGYRSGYYRILGPCGHALGYGLLLMQLIAFACYDLDRDEIYVFQRPVLIILLFVNVFLTGSRSSQAIVIIELIIFFFFSEKEKKKRTASWLLGLLSFLILFLLVAYKSKIGNYILLQITMLVDQAFGTTFSLNFGAEASRLEDSEDYRKFLPLVFTLDWLNPFVGRGIKRPFASQIFNSKGEYVFVESIDNYYVSQYIKYAYPGLVSYVLFIISTFVCMIKKFTRCGSKLLKALFVAFVCYFVNLWWVDALQTLKFLYITVAVFWAVFDEFTSNVGETTI